MRTAPEWHKLRALLARCRLLALNDTPVDGADIRLSHDQDLAHLEAAIYGGLVLKDWEKLQAFVANVAFHLQSVVPLGLSCIRKVFAWHALMISYTDRLDAGKDKAWDYIFLGQFWLDHEDELVQSGQRVFRDNEDLSVVENLHPSQEGGHLKAIERLHQCADVRQVAIAWINYLRYARQHLNEGKQSAAVSALGRLLSDTPALRGQLEADGYTVYLPPLA